VLKITQFRVINAAAPLPLLNRLSGTEADKRHYSYNERDFAIQDYRANILTTGLRFTF
jgi:hypothetical protein